jgi:transposase/transposase-like protein
VLAEFSRSGLSIADYCTQSGVAQSTLCYWRRQARETGAGRPGPVPGFARVEVEPGPALAAAGITAVVRTPVLMGRLAELETNRQALAAENRHLLLRVKALEAQLVTRAIAREAASADPGVLSLFQDMTETAAAPAPPADSPGSAIAKTVRTTSVPRPKPVRQPLDPALPREVITLPDPPESLRCCPETGVALVPGFTQALEVLARKPAVYYVRRFERTVWVSPAKTAPLTTPWPADVLPRSGVDASIVAHIAAAHFGEHVPYYRLEQQLARTGVSLARSTQVSLMSQLDTLVSPLVEHLKSRVLGSGYVHLDATPIDVCDPARPGEARSGHLWAYRARSPDPETEGLVWFDYRDTKSPVHPGAVLKEYHGVVQTDGATGLDALGPPDRITHLGCWAHARRYVVAAVKLGEARAARYLAQIDRLFRWDARWRRITRENPAYGVRGGVAGALPDPARAAAVHAGPGRRTRSATEERAGDRDRIPPEPAGIAGTLRDDAGSIPRQQRG